MGWTQAAIAGRVSGRSARRAAQPETSTELAIARPVACTDRAP